MKKLKKRLYKVSWTETHAMYVKANGAKEAIALSDKKAQENTFEEINDDTIASLVKKQI